MPELNVRIRVSVPLARWGLAGILLIAFAAELSTERFDLPTYYPAPSGIYERMITTQDALLARDGGKVGIGTTNPQALLDVNGGARIGGNLQTGGISPAGDISAGHITAAGVSVSAPGDAKVDGQSVWTAFNCPSDLKCTIDAPHTLTISGCACANWADAGCSTGSCGAYQRQQTRTCAPAGCGITSQCVGDNSCAPPCTGTSDWANAVCGGGDCTNKMQQTRYCTPQGCTGCSQSLSQCAANASCAPACPACVDTDWMWTMSQAQWNCDPGACPPGCFCVRPCAGQPIYACRGTFDPSANISIMAPCSGKRMPCQ